MPRIAILNIPDAIYEFGSETVTIGRAEDCSISIPMKSVSRIHAKLTPAEDGWLLEDMDSHNGLFLNNIRIKSALIRHTTTFRVGDVYIRLELPLSGEELLKIASDAKKILRDFDLAVTGRSGIGLNMLAAALAGGNILLNGAPGEGKAGAVAAMALMLGMPFKKIPMTPDTTPQDLLGSQVFIEDSNGLTSQFTPGPIFSNMILADELDRAPAKTQAALMEAVASGKVPTAAGYKILPVPQLMTATKKISPEEDDTPLARGILDNFMVSLDMNYPMPQDEIRIIAARTAPEKFIPCKIIDMEELAALREQVRCMQTPHELLSYAGRIVQSTRPENPESPDFIKKGVASGASTKAAADLILCARAMALLNGREQPLHEDVKAMAVPVLRHRIILNDRKNSTRNEDDIIRRLLITVSEQ